MDPAQLLHERERRLVAEYHASHPPKAFDGEDLETEDLDDVEHWVGIYTELVDFVHRLMESASQGSTEPAPRPGVRAIELQARMMELHLSYWTDRLHRLRGDPRPEADRPD